MKITSNVFEHEKIIPSKYTCDGSDISPSLAWDGVPENISTLQEGKQEGKNSWGKAGYGGPCPPSGVHRYFFKLYALDTVLTLNNGATKTEIIHAMKNHVITEAELLGKYERIKK